MKRSHGNAPCVKRVISSLKGDTVVQEEVCVSPEDPSEVMQFKTLRVTIGATHQSVLAEFCYEDSLTTEERRASWGPFYGPLGPGRHSKK